MGVTGTFHAVFITFAPVNCKWHNAMNDTKDQISEKTAQETKGAALPPIPDIDKTEDTPLKRGIRYGIGITMTVLALIGIVILFNFISGVLMDDHDVVDMPDVNLEKYVVNDPPADTRRSHVRMKPGSHPEAGYIADQSVLIREREEDTKFREQNGQTAEQQKPAANNGPAKTQTPAKQESKPAAETAKPAAEQPAPAKPAPEPKPAPAPKPTPAPQQQSPVSIE